MAHKFRRGRPLLIAGAGVLVTFGSCCLETTTGDAGTGTTTAFVGNLRAPDCTSEPNFCVPPEVCDQESGFCIFAPDAGQADGGKSGG